MEIPDEFNCCICFLVLNQPMKHSCDNHICATCIETYTKSSPNAMCPICRNPLMPATLTQDHEMQIRLNEYTVTCYCRATIALSRVNSHTDQCPAYQENINQAAEQQRGPSTGTVNRATFNCPCCAEQNMRREALLEHVNANHSGTAGVCPICAVMEYGDPNYVSQDLSGHLQFRHKYDLDTYTNYDLDDDAILQQALQQSLLDN